MRADHPHPEEQWAAPKSVPGASLMSAGQVVSAPTYRDRMKMYSWLKRKGAEGHKELKKEKEHLKWLLAG